MTKSALLIRLIDLLKIRPGITMTELVTALNRSERTIYRWLSELEEDLHAQLHCRDGGYFLADGLDSQPINLTPQELLALRLSLKSSPFCETSPIRKHASAAWAKIRNSVNSDDLAKSRDLAATHTVDVTMPTAPLDPGLIDRLETAINRRRRLKVNYRSQKSNCVKKYLIDPYAMVFRRHSWYLLAYSEEHGKVVQFKLARFKEAVDTGIRFTMPSDFSVDEYFELAWEAWGGGEPVNVKVRFAREVSRMIAESKRHPTQKVYMQPDGSAIFEATVAGTEEIAIWLMGYGKYAEVLEPQSLRDMVMDHVRAMVAMYLPAEIKTENLQAE